MLPETKIHKFKKINRKKRKKDSLGIYDVYVCENCKLKGKLYNGNSHITFPFDLPEGKKQPCIIPNQKEYIGKVITVIGSTNWFNANFKHVLPNSNHRIISAPNGFINGDDGVFIKGVDGSPIKLYFDQIKSIKAGKLIRKKNKFKRRK